MQGNRIAIFCDNYLFFGRLDVRSEAGLVCTAQIIFQVILRRYNHFHLSFSVDMLFQLVATPYNIP